MFGRMTQAVTYALTRQIGNKDWRSNYITPENIFTNDLHIESWQSRLLGPFLSTISSVGNVASIVVGTYFLLTFSYAAAKWAYHAAILRGIYGWAWALLAPCLDFFVLNEYQHQRRNRRNQLPPQPRPPGFLERLRGVLRPIPPPLPPIENFYQDTAQQPLRRAATLPSRRPNQEPIDQSTALYPTHTLALTNNYVKRHTAPLLPPPPPFSPPPAEPQIHLITPSTATFHRTVPVPLPIAPPLPTPNAQLALPHIPQEPTDSTNLNAPLAIPHASQETADTTNLNAFSTADSDDEQREQ